NTAERGVAGDPANPIQRSNRDLTPGGGLQGGRPPAVIQRSHQDLTSGGGSQGGRPPAVISSPRTNNEKVPREPWPKPQPSRDSRPFGVGPGTQLRSEVAAGRSLR